MLSGLFRARWPERGGDRPSGNVAARRCRRAAAGVRPTATRVAAGRRGGRRPLTRRGGAFGRAAAALVHDLHPVVAELVAPVLAVERPELVLVVRADLVAVPVAVPLDDLLLLLDLFFQLALLAGQNLVLDLDDALDELRQLLGEALDAAPRQIAGLVDGQ